MRVCVLGLLVAFLLSGQALAQSVPLATFEVVGGLGGHNVRVGDRVAYTDDAAWTLRFGASVRVSPARRTAFYLKADYAPAAADKVLLIECTPRPGRSCLKSFPTETARSLGLGVRSALSDAWHLGGLVGVGCWGKTGSKRATRYAEVDVMYRMGEHAGVIVAARYMTWKADGEPQCAVAARPARGSRRITCRCSPPTRSSRPVPASAHACGSRASASAGLSCGLTRFSPSLAAPPLIDPSAARAGHWSPSLTAPRSGSAVAA